MNNDISSELAKYVNNMRINHATKQPAEISRDEIDVEQSGKSYETAQNYYSSLGHAKVNMDKGVTNRIMASIDMLKQDPEYVQNHVDFCDFLQEKGYSLEDAVIGTDIVFDKLKDEKTYRS